MIVESHRCDSDEAIRWDAGEGTEIELSSFDREQVGTTIRLILKESFSEFASDADRVEQIIKEYADFLAFPVFLNGSTVRSNVIGAAWFEPTPDEEEVELALTSYFDETPLDVISIHTQNPPISGALYVSPQRTPGFADEAAITATVRRMVISRDIRGLLPDWASFLRGVLELRGCYPTASREDLVRDVRFMEVKARLEKELFDHFEQLASSDPSRMQSLLSWHRYSWAGAALHEPRILALMQRTYLFPTSRGQMTFEEIHTVSLADPIFEPEFEHVLWYNTDRRQESWINSLFHDHHAPCVHTLRSFEESLLASMVATSPQATDMRFASPSAEGFAKQILQMSDMDDAPPAWIEFFGNVDAKILVASFNEDQPVMAFLNERHELLKTFEDLKQAGTVPAGFQRLIDSHFEQDTPHQNEVLLNRNHRLVARALEQKTNSPLASVLRLLVGSALRTAGAALPAQAQRQQTDDLDWIAECLWGKSES